MRFNVLMLQRSSSTVKENFFHLFTLRFILRITKRSLSIDKSRNNSKEDVPPRKRSRNSSANSGGSVDSAIGDIYFATTPHSDLERELLELTSASCEAAAAALCSAGNKQVDFLQEMVFSFYLNSCFCKKKLLQSHLNY